MTRKLTNWLIQFSLHLRGHVVEVFEDRKEISVNNARDGDLRRTHTMRFDKGLLEHDPGDEAARVKAMLRLSESLTPEEMRVWMRTPKRWNGIEYELEVVP